jgi:transcription initiation factor TFIIIB Brf1 subunit/transcription initiation factor TFIIB
MLSLDFENSCVECCRPLLDAGDELVCPGCGIVKGKEVLETRGEASPKFDLGSHSLGSYMGSIQTTQEERRSRGFSRTNSTYGYLKVISDFAGREDGADYACYRMIRRVSEKLYLPDIVIQQAAAVARKLLATKHHGRRVTIAAVSAYSLIIACKIETVTSVSLREIIDAHTALGRRVKASSIIQLSLESPIKSVARRPEEYVSKILAKLSLNERIGQTLIREGLSQTAFLNSLRTTALEVLAKVDSDVKVGRRPCALAASAVYAAEVVLARRGSRKRWITQRDLAECGDSAEYTIRGQVTEIFMPVVERLASGKRSLPVASLC